jgi:ABC-type nitrate/sulfonate/bicarbonate transport system permease component
MLPPSPGGVPEDPGAVVTVVPVVDRTRFLIRQDRRLLSLLAVACVLLVWEGVTRAGLVQSLFLPRPSAILAEGWAMIRTGELWGHLGTSLGRILMGMAVGASLGVVVGYSLAFPTWPRPWAVPWWPRPTPSPRSPCCLC